MPERKICRKIYKELRDSMTQEQVIAKSEAICKRFLESAEYQDASMILAYAPLGKEVNSYPIMEQALRDKKKVMLPKTAPEFCMDFYEIHTLAELEEGNFHVMEPKSDCVKWEPEEYQEDVISKILALVPGVVFDRKGNRYGYGKGYYDRYFARFPRLRRIALAYTQQLSEEPLESLHTDVKMHTILTDTERIDID